MCRKVPHRLVSTVFGETSDDWETQRPYPNTKARLSANSSRHLRKSGCRNVSGLVSMPVSA